MSSYLNCFCIRQIANSIAFLGNTMSSSLNCFCIRQIGYSIAFLGCAKSSSLNRFCIRQIVDSIAFPAVAFGIFSLSLSATQAATKIIGGAVWSFVLVWLFHSKEPRA